MTLPLMYFWFICSATPVVFLQSSTTWYGQQPWGESNNENKLEMETQVNWGTSNSTTHHEEEPPPTYDDVTGSPQQPTQQQQQPEEQPQVVLSDKDSDLKSVISVKKQKKK